jgi:hypothetical protein
VNEGIELIVLAAGGAGAATAASGVVAAITGAEPTTLLGRVVTPAGLYDDNAWMTRCLALRDALYRVRDRDGDPRTVLAALGGADIAAATGLILGAASRRTPVMFDGPVGAAAALLANDLAPQSRRWLLLPDTSRHPAVRLAAESLELRPWLDLCLDLGEGAAGLAALPMLQTALTLAGAGEPVDAAPLTRYDSSGNQVFVGIAKPVEPAVTEPEPGLEAADAAGPDSDLDEATTAMKASTVESTPVTGDAAPVKATPKPAPPKPAPAKTAPAKETPAKDPVMKATPAAEPPAKAAEPPAKATPAMETPAKATPAAEPPAKDAAKPAKVAPAAAEKSAPDKSTVDKPVEKAAATPAAGKPAEPTADKADKPVQPAADKAEKPSDKATEKPADKPAELTADKADKPKPAPPPGKTPAVKPAGEPVKAPVKETAAKDGAAKDGVATDTAPKEADASSNGARQNDEPVGAVAAPPMPAPRPRKRT